MFSIEEQTASTSQSQESPFQHKHQSIPTPLYGFLCQCVFSYGVADIDVYMDTAQHTDQDQQPWSLYIRLYEYNSAHTPGPTVLPLHIEPARKQN